MRRRDPRIHPLLWEMAQSLERQGVPVSHADLVKYSPWVEAETRKAQLRMRVAGLGLRVILRLLGL